MTPQAANRPLSYTNRKGWSGTPEFFDLL